MTRKKLDVIGWNLFALLSFTGKPGVIVIILACVCFVFFRLGMRSMSWHAESSSQWRGIQYEEMAISSFRKSHLWMPFPTDATRSRLPLGHPGNRVLQVMVATRPSTSTFLLCIAILAICSPNNLPAQAKPATNSGAKGEYELHDDIKHTVVVDAAGSGDFQDVNSCWMALAGLSAYDNQYLVKVLPGTYHPVNGTPPPYSHTIGMGPLRSVIFQDASGSPRMIDQQYPSKLENLVFDLANSQSYIIHIDAPGLSYGVTVDTDCVFIHRGGGAGAAVIGGGAWPGYKSVWNSCVFIGYAGPPTIHTKENTDNFVELEFNQCSFPQGLNLGSLGTAATSKATFNGGSLHGQGLGFFISSLSNQPELWKFPANNINWTVRGSAQGLVCKAHGIANGGEALKLEAKEFGQEVAISGSAATLLFGEHNWRTTLPNARIHGGVIGWADVRDVQMGRKPYSAPQDIIQFWRRLGDCSVSPKTLTVAVNGVKETFTFTANYLESRPSESSLIDAINAAFPNVTMSKMPGINFGDIMQTPDKLGAQSGDGDGLITNELVYLEGYLAHKAPQAAARDKISGIVLWDARQKEPTEIWSGPLYWEAPDGEYGVGTNHQLSIDETVKVGHVKDRVFYPYY